MIVQIDDKLISTELFKREFVCNLSACKGQCCIDGDAGAPLTKQEVTQIEVELERYLPYMSAEGIQVVEKEGIWYEDPSGEPVTTLINEGACVFVKMDKNGVAKCAIEQAYSEGKTDFKKPISCHLYPIRVQQYEHFQALNYDEWDICKDACMCGENLHVPVFRFLKEPIIRAWGQEFFDDMCEIEQIVKEEDAQVS